ncbi:ABC transporter [Hypericibacter adhaerens]|uniref:ABC transporter n=1 Tax=Hypericibacter adhaerens TaxID=2602016 RepID=A0A5J6N122_9PROT|nr:ABC transporter ATP-binding protein [Hypericibacter adhaerens]QEX23708.1 ABC transporter [Hypericibacter adhaerens]
MIRVEDLVFDYPGFRALDGVSFAVEPHSITALVGPNGAGKTTLLNCMAGLALPAAGRVQLDQIDVHRTPREAHARMGYLSDFFGLYSELSVQRCLDYRARAQGIPSDRRAAAVQRAAERLGLADRLKQRAGELSRGLRQRLAIAQAIVHEPAVILLDEPASGLDPEARFGLAAVLRGLKDEGMTLIVSSHILAELEDYSTHLLVLEQGRILDYHALDGAPAPNAARRFELQLVEPRADLAAVLTAAGLGDVRIEGRLAHFTMAGDAAVQAALLRRLIEAGLPVAGFAATKADLQDAYLALLKDSRARASAAPHVNGTKIQAPAPAGPVP